MFAQKKLFLGQSPTAAAAAVYIEDVFSTYLYTGTGSGTTITVNNGINLTEKGGLVWRKSRNLAFAHDLFDTARGNNNSLSSNTTGAQSSSGSCVFQSTGFQDAVGWGTTDTVVSWTFRKQAKFFDVVTYTGNGSSTGRNISHSLGSEPGCIIVKATSAVDSWWVYHRATDATVPAQYALELNSTAARNNNAGFWANTAPTSTVFTVGGSAGGGLTNVNGVSYVAYLFAHNAGGFGAAGTDNVISCGSYTGNGSATAGPYVSLGYEPQFILVKGSSQISNWRIVDSMRGMSLTQDAYLSPNLSNAETSYAANTGFQPDATGFRVNTTDSSVNVSGQTYIYIAIRRGPMRTPTSGTSVFGLSARSGTGANATVTGSAGVSDAALIKNRGSAVGDLFAARLTGTGYMETSAITAEVAAGTTILQANPWDVMDGVKVGTTSTITNATSNTYINYLFDRAPGFFDVVCYTGTGVARTVNHNLGAVPELMIVKTRSAVNSWLVYAAPLGATKRLFLSDTSAEATSSAFWNNTAPTSSVFTVGTADGTNLNAATIVAYLFATVAGVSKVGSYTGTGTTKQIDCGFTNGSRFVMIKRTDSTGDWYVWDSARGIVAGNDPYLFLNSTADEVTNTDYVDTYSAGFEISSTAPAAINANGGTFIFLAIA